MLTKQQKLESNSDYETWERKKEPYQRKKEEKKKKDGKERINAPDETPFPDIRQAPLEDLDSSAKMKKNYNLKHDVSR